MRDEPYRAELLSLREIGRRLGIPPSSISYYKDRFSTFIPSEGSGGRRSRYPADALGVFRDIREMFGKGLSADQVERELVLQYGERESAEQETPPVPVSAAPEPDAAFLREITGLLDRMNRQAEAQEALRAESEALRRELTAVRQAKAEGEEEYRRELAMLQAEVDSLRSERADLLDAMMSGIRDSRRRPDRPPPEFLMLPLVIRSERGEFLGVSGRGKRFTLQDFIDLVERGAGPEGEAAMVWKSVGSRWRLQMGRQSPRSGRTQDHEFEFARTVTPNDNKVCELVGMAIDGMPAPDRFLLVLFRKIRDDFSG